MNGNDKRVRIVMGVTGAALVAIIAMACMRGGPEDVILKWCASKAVDRMAIKEDLFLQGTRYIPTAEYLQEEGLYIKEIRQTSDYSATGIVHSKGPGEPEWIVEFELAKTWKGWKLKDVEIIHNLPYDRKLLMEAAMEVD